MLGKLSILKYVDPRSPLVTISISNKQMSNVLVDLGVTLNVMTLETLESIVCT